MIFNNLKIIHKAYYTKHYSMLFYMIYKNKKIEVIDMEKAYHASEYDILARELSLQDKFGLLDNLTKLANYNEGYSDILNDLIVMSKTKVEIQQGLDREKFFDAIYDIYDIGPFFIDAIFHCIETRLNIEVNPYETYNNMCDFCYNTYINDFDLFMKCIKELEYIEIREKYKLMTKKKIKMSTIPNEIPPVPEIPAALLGA